MLEAVDDGRNITLQAQSPDDSTKTYLEAKGKEYADGDFIINDYILDSETYALTEYKGRCIHNDGGEDLLYEVAITYDVQRPEIAQNMMERSNPETDFRTLTVVLDPNTE